MKNRAACAMISSMEIQNTILHIAPLDEAAMAAAQARLDALVKPPGSLGDLERYAVRLAGIYGQVPQATGRRAILVFSADNGVCAEGIGSAPQSVTAAQTVNFVRGVTGVGALAGATNTEVWVADVGMLAPVRYPGVRNLRVRAGTGNIRVEDAMTRQEAKTAVLAGMRLAREAAAAGVRAIGVGEMGIGNTTTSTAVLSALTGEDSDRLTGMGGGLGERLQAVKRAVIRDALARAQADASDVMGVLSKLGGLDICAMAGAYLGAASARIPAVIDGYIGCVAALAAVRLAPEVKAYLFASHVSEEPGAALALEALGLEAPLRLRLRLGEGSGCPLLFSLLDAACAVYHKMATFEEARIDPGYLEKLKR